MCTDHHVHDIANMVTHIISIGAVIEGPSDVIYFPNQGPNQLPVELTCTISEGSTGWRVNGDRIYTLTEIRNGELAGHSLNGANLVINTPVNNTEYNCVSIRDDGNVISDPAFLYIAGMFYYNVYYNHTQIYIQMLFLHAEYTCRYTPFTQKFSRNVKFTDFAVSSQFYFSKRSSGLRKQYIQLDDQQKFNHKILSDLPSVKYESCENFRIYSITLHKCFSKKAMIICTCVYFCGHMT